DTRERPLSHQNEAGLLGAARTLPMTQSKGQAAMFSPGRKRKTALIRITIQNSTSMSAPCRVRLKRCLEYMLRIKTNKVKTPSLVNLLQERGFSKTILSNFSLHIPSNKCDREQNAAGKHNECPIDGSRS